MFKWLKNKILERMYKNCKEELEFTKNFYMHRVWSHPSLKGKNGVELQEFYEREIYVRIPSDVYEIYYKKFGYRFPEQLKADAFGTQNLLNEQVKFLFEEACLDATRK